MEGLVGQSVSVVQSVDGKVGGLVDHLVGQSDGQLDSTVLWPSLGLINPDEAVM